VSAAEDNFNSSRASNSNLVFAFTLASGK